MNTIVRLIDSFFMYLSNRKELKRLRKAKRDALLLAEKNNQRYYVLPDWNGIPRAMTREHIIWLKKKRRLGSNVNIYHLTKEALFIADPPVVLRRKQFIN